MRTLYIVRILKAPSPKAGGKPPPISTAIELLLGAIAGALAQLFTIPVSVIATRQQIGSANANNAAPRIANSAGPAAGAGGEKSLADVVKQEPSVAGKAKAVGKKVLEDEDSFVSVAKDIYAQDGITGFWRGLKPSLVLTVNPAITYGVFERE